MSTNSRPIRILELRSVWGTGGGPEKTILLGAALSDPAKYAVTVCYIRDKRDPVFGPASKATGLPIDYVEVRERNSFDPSIWRKLRRLVREKQIDIVHAHEYKTDLLALLLSRYENVIPLATAHAWTGNTWREQFYYFADKRILRSFPFVVAVSSEIRSELLRCGVAPERVGVVLNGIDPQLFKRDYSYEAQAREKLGLPPGRTIIGAVGRLELQKRFDLLIDSFAQLSRKHADLFLVIAGDGGLRSALELQAARYGLEQSIRFLGHQSDVSLVHHAIDIYVQSSQYEGTPNSVLEAMALESSIIATDVGGTSELVRDGVDGLIVRPNHLDSLCHAIENVLHDSSAASLRKVSARARVEQELSFDTRMKKIESLYVDLIGCSSNQTALASCRQ